MGHTREFLRERNCRRKPLRAFIGTCAPHTHVRNMCGDYVAYTGRNGVCAVTSHGSYHDYTFNERKEERRGERERERKRENRSDDVIFSVKPRAQLPTWQPREPFQEESSSSIKVRCMRIDDVINGTLNRTKLIRLFRACISY